MPITLFIFILLTLLGAIVFVSQRLNSRPDFTLSGFNRLYGPTLLLLGAFLLVLSLSQFEILKIKPTVVVIVDRSGSTRPADYRDPSRLKAWLDRLSRRADVTLVSPGGESISLESVSVDHEQDAQLRLPFTSFDLALLLSDGRLDTSTWPKGVPMLALQDAQLASPRDGRIVSVQHLGTRSHINIVNTSGATDLEVVLPTGTDVLPVKSGESTIVVDSVDSLRATLLPSSRDRWPENDTMSSPSSVTSSDPLWFVGEGPAPRGYRLVQPHSLPTDLAGYAQTTTVVFDALAGPINLSQQQALEKFVTDFGGTLLLTIPNPRDASRSNRDQPLVTLSPLSLDPPTARQIWYFLVDVSGSMAQPTKGGAPAYEFALDSISASLIKIPPEDFVRVGVFARDFRWITTATNASSISRSSFDKVLPGGPTNLVPALRTIIDQHTPGLPAKLILITDSIGRGLDPELGLLARSVTDKQIQLSILSTSSDDSPDTVLSKLAIDSGGQKVKTTPELFTDRISNIATESDSAASRSRVDVVAKIDAATSDEFASLGDLSLRDAPLEVWPRSGARTIATDAKQTVRMASWRRGLGQVLSVAGTVDSAVLGLIGEAAGAMRTPELFELAMLSLNKLQLRTADARQIAPANKVVTELRSLSGSRRVSMVRIGPDLFESRDNDPVLAESRSVSRAVALEVSPNGQTRELTSIGLNSSPGSEFVFVGSDVASLGRISTRDGAAQTAKASVDFWSDDPSLIQLPDHHAPIPPWLAVVFAMMCTALALFGLGLFDQTKIKIGRSAKSGAAIAD